MTASNGKRARLFTADQRAQILSLALGKPTGVIAVIGGMEFDLPPISFADISDVLDIVGKVAKILQRRSELSEQDLGAELASLVSADGDRLIRMIRNLLRRAGGVSTPEEEALFAQWFEALSPADVLRELVPKVLEANGVRNMFARPPQAPASSEPAPA